MDSTRRGFLGLLAHLPLVGAWLGRPKPEKMYELAIDESRLGRISVAEEMDLRSRCIEWIPVTERLPEIRKWSSNIFDIAGQSLLVIVATNRGVFAACLFEYTDGTKDWRSQCLDVTHWAELPAPPAQICAKGGA